MEHDAFVIECSGVELYYLGLQCDGQLLIGIDDPFADPLLDVMTSLSAAEERLVERGYLERQADGGLMLDGLIEVMVRIAVAPEISVVVTARSATEAPTRATYHLQGALGIEVAPLVDDTYRLTTVNGVAGIVARIVDRWAIPERPAPARQAEPAMAIKHGTFQQIARQATGAEAATAQVLLRQEGLADETASALAATLASSERSGALTVVCRGEQTWDGAGLAMLGGADGLWMIESAPRAGEAWLEVSPCSSAHVIAQIDAAIRRLPPSPGRAEIHASTEPVAVGQGASWNA